MKISTRRILLATFAGVGLFAVALAYRSAPQQTSASPNNGLPAIASPQVEQTLQVLPREEMVQEQLLEPPVSLQPSETVQASAAFDLSASLSPPEISAEPLDLFDDATEVDDIDLPETDTEKKTLLSTKAKGWQANRFLGSEKRPSTAEQVSAELELEAEAQAEVVQSVLSEPTADEPHPDVDFTAKPVGFEGEAATPTSVVSGLNESSAHKAVHHIEYGKSLARRNASEAASQEFLTALRILAESNDSQARSKHYTSSLRNGLLAIQEAADFKTDDPQRQIVVNVANIMESHETQVVSQEQAQTLSATDAIHHYLIYAGEQLAICGGQNVVAAEALYCLGKMRSISAQESSNPDSLDLMQAIVYHHASLTANPGNFRSANELGVLLARNGQLDEAESFLKASLQIRPMPQSWANLAKVHQRKGTPQDLQLANLAMSEYQSTLQNETESPLSGAIQWVDSATFAARSATEYPEGMPVTMPPSRATVMPASNVEDGKEKKSFVQRIGDLIPKGIRR